MDLNQLRELQASGATDLVSTLRSVQFNPVDICNRFCSFCPRSNPDIYTNKNWVISNETTTKVAVDLADMNFNGRIGFVGFGEPLLHKRLAEQIEIVAKYTNAQWIDVNTNGDFLTSDKIKDFANAGCTHVVVSMYDKDITEELTDMKGSTNIEIVPRHCYPEKFELQLVDRTNNIVGSKLKNINEPCYLPFYKMFIDWNGDVLVCSEDWARKSNLGNVHKSTVKKIWLGEEAMEYRKNLLQGLRSNKIPCSTCDINGTKYGKDSVDVFCGNRL